MDHAQALAASLARVEQALSSILSLPDLSLKGYAIARKAVEDAHAALREWQNTKETEGIDK